MEHRPTDERRAQITAALLRVMADHGYAKATIAKIAAEADLTAGLLHYHFKTKQEILLALLDSLVDSALASVSAEGDPPARLSRIIDQLLAAGSEARPDAVAAWVTVGAEAIRQPAVRDRFQAALGQLAHVVAAAVDAGVESGDWQPAVPTAEIVGAFLALVQGYYSLAATARDLVPRSSAAPAARLLLSAFLKTEVP